MPASAKLRLLAQTRCIHSTSPRLASRSLAREARPNPQEPIFTRPSLKPSRKEQTAKQFSADESPSEFEEPRVSSGLLSCHWDTLPPTPAQLSHASKFFATHPPKFLWSAEKFKTMDFGSSPEICFLGRSNVGKSSLLNALLLRRVAFTSSKPGRTKLMNAFAVGGDQDNGKNRLVVMDMPGYGHGGRREWGTQIMKYLEKRKQLKRAFLLVNTEHGLKDMDKQLIIALKQLNIPFQVILSKVDDILFPGRRFPGKEALQARLDELQKVMENVKYVVQPDTEDDSGACGEIIACSATKWIGGKRMGIEAVRFAMLRAAGLEYRESTKLAKAVEIVPHEEVTWKGQDIKLARPAVVPQREAIGNHQKPNFARPTQTRSEEKEAWRSQGESQQKTNLAEAVEIVPHEEVIWRSQVLEHRQKANSDETEFNEKITWRPQGLSR